MSLHYSKGEIYSYGKTRSFPAEATEAAFLLGGIGTGNLSLGARGELRDWEIFNSPGKGNFFPYTFFTIWAKEEGRPAVCKLLESKIQPPYSKSHGFISPEVAGLPRLESSVLRGEYPFVEIDFSDRALPVKVKLEAFTPLSPDLDPEEITYGSMSLMAASENITAKPSWLEGGWCDGIQDFWDDLCEDGKLEMESVFDALGSRISPPTVKVGSLGIFHIIEPDEEKFFEFILSWYFPNRPRSWGVSLYRPYDCSKGEGQKNYYSTLFSNAWDVGSYLIRNMERLEGITRKFHRALYSSTYPDYVIDALASNITALRSTTCFRVVDGTFFGFEGCHDKVGCCEASCTHVWNYAQTVAFLFPDLEQSMRLVEFNIETDNNGNMAYRAMRAFGEEPYDIPPATDGQLGTIIRLYRDWKISGKDDLIEAVWPRASKALDFAFSYWDSASFKNSLRIEVSENALLE